MGGGIGAQHSAPVRRRWRGAVAEIEHVAGAGKLRNLLAADIDIAAGRIFCIADARRRECRRGVGGGNPGNQKAARGRRGLRPVIIGKFEDVLGDNRVAAVGARPVRRIDDESAGFHARQGFAQKAPDPAQFPPAQALAVAAPPLAPEGPRTEGLRTENVRMIMEGDRKLGPQAQVLAKRQALRAVIDADQRGNGLDAAVDQIIRGLCKAVGLDRLRRGLDETGHVDLDERKRPHVRIPFILNSTCIMPFGCSFTGIGSSVSQAKPTSFG